MLSWISFKGNKIFPLLISNNLERTMLNLRKFLMVSFKCLEVTMTGDAAVNSQEVLITIDDKNQLKFNNKVHFHHHRLPIPNQHKIFLDNLKFQRSNLHKLNNLHVNHLHSDPVLLTNSSNKSLFNRRNNLSEDQLFQRITCLMFLTKQIKCLIKLNTSNSNQFSNRCSKVTKNNLLHLQAKISISKAD